MSAYVLSEATKNWLTVSLFYCEFRREFCLFLEDECVFRNLFLTENNNNRPPRVILVLESFSFGIRLSLTIGF